jgi:hypothetical protein
MGNGRHRRIFREFLRAGLKVGVPRPQQIMMIDGKPAQGMADDQHARFLKDKLAYAKKRWSCTLFISDSTVTVTRNSLSLMFQGCAADMYPDVADSRTRVDALLRLLRAI